MRSSKFEKTQKIPSTKNLNPNVSKNLNPNVSNLKFSFHNYTNLTNQQYLFHSLKLLGVTQSQYLKETKLSMNDQIFSKSQSPTTTKQFFFIVITCLKFLCNQEDFNAIKIWFPPRTVNEQLEFKKTLYNLFTKLQTKNKIPKKLLIGKNFLMAETPHSKIIQFLRILAQLALRSQYLQKYSKDHRLTDICFTQTQIQQKQPNDINRFYVYPFTPSQSISNPILQEQQVESLKDIYKTHIQIYRKKILSLASKYPKQELIECQQMMSNLVEQKQLCDKLNKKIPKYVLSENRAFDRRKLIDKSNYIWENLHKLQCHFVQKSQTQSVLKLQGQIDKILLKWETPTGINKMIDICKMTDKLGQLKQNCQKRQKDLELFIQKMNSQLKKYEKS